jgi:DNA-binding MarR family transcriptional regulator
MPTPDHRGASEREASAEVARLLYETTFVFWGHFVARAAELGLAPTQAHALTVLEPDRPMTMGEMATALECDPSTVTGVADRLEAQGFVERQPLPGDRRVRALALTGPGRERRASLVARMLEAPESVRGLPADELRSLGDALRAILGREADLAGSVPAGRDAGEAGGAGERSAATG